MVKRTNKFFGKSLSIGKVEIDADSVSSDSPQMLKRLDRISDNYAKLDLILSDMESKIAQDEHLNPPKADQTDNSQARTGSANPKKPR